MGDKMTDQELDEMLDAADTKHDGMVNYTGLQLFLNFENLFLFQCLNVKTIYIGSNDSNYNLFVTSKKMKPPIHEFKVLQNVF